MVETHIVKHPWISEHLDSHEMPQLFIDVLKSNNNWFLNLVVEVLKPSIEGVVFMFDNG